MNPPIVDLKREFFDSYDAAAKDEIWKKQSEVFRSFWSSRIMDAASPPLAEEECDRVIRILDRNGKGNTRDSEAVAGGAMIPQGAWRRMLASFREEKRFALLVDHILQSRDTNEKAGSIDELYETNQGQIPRLTGQAGITINTFLAAHDPFLNLSITSIKDRWMLISFFEFPVPFDWEKASIGTKIVQSNTILSDSLHAAGIQGSARTLSIFCYFA